MHINWKKPSLRQMLFLAVMGAGACLCLNLLIFLLHLRELFPVSAEASGEIYDMPFWQQAAVSVLVMPAVEELAFRGLVYQALRRNSGFAASAVLSAACFGLYHGNMLQGLYGFFIGLLLAWTLEKSGSILFPIVLHGAANLAALAATAIGFGSRLYGGPAWWAAAFLCGLVCAGASCFLSRDLDGSIYEEAETQTD